MSKSQGRFSELDDPAFEGLRLDVDPAEIRASKEEIGEGTYGTVYKVKLRGTLQAAKEFHSNITIKGKNAKDKRDALTKFLRCARLRHSNIVEIFGIYENKAIHPTTMVLVMELMDCSLNSLLENESEISNSTKLSILLDVSSGLKYLHSQNPPIAHYYLSSSNVLLTANRKAKISDVGVDRLVTYISESKASHKAQAFMAPEIKKSKATFGLPADVFSYGAVMLHTITQKQLTVMPSAQPNKQLQFNYRSQFDEVVADSFFCQLKEIVRSCLLSDPNRRPQITLVSQVIEMIKLLDATKSPVVMASSDHTESLLTSHGHCEVQQTLEQAQPAISGSDVTISGSDVRSINPDCTIAKPVPTLPYAIGNHGPKVIGFHNLGNTCFFNSMLQCIHQTVDLHYAIANGKRVYPIENSIEGLLPVEVTKSSRGLTATLQGFFSRVNQHSGTISPNNLLQAIGRNNYRFGRGTQEDSHEVLRCLLSGLREEEINCIKQGVYSHYNINQNFLKDKNIDGETKLSIKEYLSKVSKGVCDIDCTLGVEIITTTICHECETPLQLKEFCLDLALPMPQTNQMDDGRHGSIVTSKEKFNKHLKNKGLHYHNPVPSVNFETQLEGCLRSFTKLDVLDDKNKFICHSCSNARDFQITQCRVSKQILIHKLSPVLILQMKRFTIGSHNVTKDNRHVSFPRVLNMAPYCTTECLEDFADSKDKILYGLYGVVVHGGSLHGGHYTACVRQRPSRKNLSKQPDVSQQTYDEKAAEDGQWYYTSDSHVSTSGFDGVKGSQAYLLFYEMLPGNEWLREVKRVRKATKDQNEPDEVLELANRIEDSIKDKVAGFQNKLDGILQEFKKSFEETLQDVEQLRTKHLQKVKQLEEDQASQATKFALESKSRIEELKTALMRNASISKTKVQELEGKISMQSNTMTQQETKMEELKLALKENEDSKQAAEVEHQQILEQHKAKMTTVEKELQDTVTEKNKALEKSNEEYQQLLEELEQYKAIVKEKEKTITKQNTEIEKLKNPKREVEESRQATETEHQKPLEQHKASEQQLSVPVNKDGTLPNQNKEAVKTLDDDSQSELETTPQHIKKQDVQNSDNANQSKQMSGKPQEDDNQPRNDEHQENGKQQENGEHQRNVEQQGINEKPEDDQQQQTDKLHENKEQQISNGQSNNEQQESAISDTRQQKTQPDQITEDDEATDHDKRHPQSLEQQKEKDEQNSHHNEQQKSDDESQKNSELHSDKPQDQVDSEQQSGSELHGSNEDNNQQETDNPIGNNDAEKQQENQQSDIDLPRQDDQSKKNLENGYVASRDNEATRQDQITEDDNQQYTTDHDGNQSLEQHKHCGSQLVNDEQKDDDRSQNNSEQQDKPQGDDGEQENIAKDDLEKQKEKQQNAKQQENSEHQGNVEQQGINEKPEDDQQQQTDKLHENEKQQISNGQSNNEQQHCGSQPVNDEQEDDDGPQNNSEQQDKPQGDDGEQENITEADLEKQKEKQQNGTQQENGEHQGNVEQQGINEKPEDDQRQQTDKLHENKKRQEKDEQNSHHNEQQKSDGESQKNSELHSDKPQDQVDSEQQSGSELHGSNKDNNQQETDNPIGNNDAEKQQDNQQSNINLPQQDDQSKKNGYVASRDNEATSQDQITEDNNQQCTTDRDGRQPLEQHKRCGSQPVNDEQKDDNGSQKNSEQQDKPQGDDGEQESAAKDDLEKQKEKQQSDNQLSRKDQENQGENCTKIKPIKVGSVNTQKESDATGED